MVSEFRKYLAHELAERSKRNPSYSLRAFAKQLGLDSSYLSKILNGRRQISPKTILKLSKKIGLEPQQIPNFLPLNGRGATESYFEPIEIDQFRLIADWYHYAILELTHASDFVPDVKWVARTLKISFGEALDAFERLKRLNRLEVTQDGTWLVRKNNSTVHHHFTTEALKKMQRQILQQSVQALDEVPFEQRDQSTITMCVNLDRLEKAKRKIKKFRRELMQFLEGGSHHDRVYQLCISLFPVSHHAKKGEGE